MNSQITELFRLHYLGSREESPDYNWRRSALIRLRNLLEENEAEILRALERDLGKPRFEAYTAEIYIVLKEITHALKSLRKWLKPKRASAGILNFPARAKVHYRPKGVVLIIAPWNYPVQLLLSPLVGALAAGNRAILKPSELTPETSALMKRLIDKYFDNHPVSVVEGGVPETTELLAYPFDHIFYTGNGQVGRIVMEAAAKYLTPVTLELGGKSPALIWGENNLAVAVRRLLWGKMLNSAQTCVAPDYLIVRHSEREAVVELIKKELKRLKGRNYQGSGKIVNERHFDRLRALTDDPSAEVLVSGVTDRASRRFDLHILKCGQSSLAMKDEIFGPVLPIIEVASFEEAIGFIKKRDRPLAAYIFSSEEDYVERFKQEITSGGMCVRDSVLQLTSDELPFGGVGPSGMGNYHGRYSFETFSHSMSVLERSYWFDLPMRFPPYRLLSKVGLKLLRFLSRV